MKKPLIKPSWPKEGGPGRALARFKTPGPVEITKTLIWMMRDRGAMSPVDLCGFSRQQLEERARQRKKNRSSYETFGEALEDAIASGWIEGYEVDGEAYYIPNYRREQTGPYVEDLVSLAIARGRESGDE